MKCLGREKRLREAKMLQLEITKQPLPRCPKNVVFFNIRKHQIHLLKFGKKIKSSNDPKKAPAIGKLISKCLQDFSRCVTSKLILMFLEDW